MRQRVQFFRRLAWIYIGIHIPFGSQVRIGFHVSHGSAKVLGASSFPRLALWYWGSLIYRLAPHDWVSLSHWLANAGWISSRERLAEFEWGSPFAWLVRGAYLSWGSLSRMARTTYLGFSSSGARRCACKGWSSGEVWLVVAHPHIGFQTRVGSQSLNGFHYSYGSFLSPFFYAGPFSAGRSLYFSISMYVPPGPSMRGPMRSWCPSLSMA